MRVVAFVWILCFLSGCGKRVATATTDSSIDAAVVQHATHHAHVVDSIIYRFALDGGQRVDSPKTATQAERPQSGTITQVVYHHAYDTIKAQREATEHAHTEEKVEKTDAPSSWLSDKFFACLGGIAFLQMLLLFVLLLKRK